MAHRSRGPIAVVQARMGSTRLPAKVMRTLVGKPVLWHVINRLSFCRRLEGIVVATSTHPEDDVIEQWCGDQGVRCFRGSEQDVLGRYYEAAQFYDADPVVRITGDCPVIDPTVVDEVVEGFYEGQVHVYSLGGDFPDGLDCEVFAFWVLKETWQRARLPSEREHVSPYMYKHPEQFRVGCLEKFENLGHHRWTLDEEADLHFLQALFSRLYREECPFLTEDILALLDREPDLMDVNREMVRNEGYLRSLQADPVVGRGN